MDCCYDLDENRLRESVEAVVNLKSELQLIIENVEFEDKSRCLFSLNESKTDQVKFPTFRGSEDKITLSLRKKLETVLKETESEEKFNARSSGIC